MVLILYVSEDPGVMRMKTSYKRMRMTTSWSDYLGCQLTANKQPSTLESLPIEILEPILEEVQLNSISGLRALAGASRTWRALTSPYFFKALKCEFKELHSNNIPAIPPVVTLRATDNFKTLKFHEEAQPGRDSLMTVNQVLSIENTFECFEHLPKWQYHRFELSAPALDVLSNTLPLLSRLVIDLGDFIGYSMSWDQAYKKARFRCPGYPHVPLTHTDGLDMICAIARFPNLRHVALHYKLLENQVALMHPNIGCEVVREVFQSIQRRKRGQALVRLDVKFYTSSRHLSNTMTIACNNDISSQGGKQPQYNCTCDNPYYGKVIERRKRAIRLYGERSWHCYLGRIQQNLLQGKYATLPWSTVMESVMCLALMPSYLVFENGKRVQFKPSLVDDKDTLVDVRV